MNCWIRLAGVGVLVAAASGCTQVNAPFEPVSDVKDLVTHIQAHRVAGSSSAGAVRVSLPLPRGNEHSLVIQRCQTQASTVGWWCRDRMVERPRRVLLFGCTTASDVLEFGVGSPAEGLWTGPAAAVRVVRKRHASATPWEENELVLTGDGGELGLRVGLVVGGDYHWWQWVRMEIIEDGPVVRTVRAKGAIPIHWEHAESPEAQATREGAFYAWLHTHNHIRGEIIARCYVNGVIELHIRHINGRFFTEGGDVEGVTPIIGFRAPHGRWPDEPTPVTRRERWRFGEVSIDNADGAHLLSEAHPGLAWRHQDLCIYQPYEGVEVMAGVNNRGRTGDAHMVRASDRVIPKGMGRTVRMTAAIGDAEPDVGVYILPDWWYALCEELSTEPYLPVRDDKWDAVMNAMTYFREGHHRGRFDDGAVPRGGPYLVGEPGWEGDIPHAQLMGAYLTGEARDYDAALRSVYHVGDVAVDKAVYSVRMHGYSAPAQSLPMQRTMGLVAGYLENGDPYLMDNARSVSESAYSWDRYNWPRRSYGRDAAYIRGLVFLYRYTGDRTWIDKAGEALHRLVQCQLSDGSFADQGCTVGIHAAMGVIVKPWMGCIATEAMVDYLACEDDPVIEAAALRFCRWLLDCRFETDGVRHWVYQVSHAGEPIGHRVDGSTYALNRSQWHVEYLAKLLAWASMRTGDPAYYEAWLEAYRLQADAPEMWDHNANKIVCNLTAQRAMLWRATWEDGEFQIAPRTDLAPDLEEGIISTPRGQVRVLAGR